MSSVRGALRRISIRQVSNYLSFYVIGSTNNLEQLHCQPLFIYHRIFMSKLQRWLPFAVFRILCYFIFFFLRSIIFLVSYIRVCFIRLGSQNIKCQINDAFCPILTIHCRNNRVVVCNSSFFKTCQRWGSINGNSSQFGLCVECTISLRCIHKDLL